ncbi:MAG: bifunctional adenosylcobinamide kinase/adenosylcobinamide-phosphate guanylyltransferase [Sphingomonas phyllosphaerae]|uniref:bifunctional adenosylcobinamide kinase/adenosylcobinamide-phosphate guanylyltransferase n=1 Tax=Sphingomonas phyllosphaerae TaxID=257003 RepID=UPI002FFBF9AD
MTDDPWQIRLVLGGARSGKSRHAQALVEACAAPWRFVATAQAFDAEMAERIAQHRADRSDAWQTIEAPLALPETIAAVADGVLLVDCLTLWTSNLLLAEADIEAATDALVAALTGSAARIVLVSNEVGWGIVPDNALARRFRDVAGRVNQRVAAAADRVDLLVAGLPMSLK